MRLIVVILLVILGLLQYRLWFSPGGLNDVNELEQTKQELTDENEQLSERNASLTAEVIDLQHGLEAVEERARSDMGMIKSDEVFYQIIEDPDVTDLTDLTDVTAGDLLSETPLEEPVAVP